jgi:DNA-binding NarL/FixJ family response regulator
MAQRYSAAHHDIATLEKAPTGIIGLDQISGGGLPKGRTTIVCGGPGCGKTMLGLEFLVRGVTEFNEPGVLILNGVAAVRRILRECPKMRILVFSVHESDQTIREILSSGAHGYLSKAKAGEELVQVVKLLLSGKTFYPEKAAAS